MAVIIGADNGTISGSGGLKLAGDSSGIVQLTSGANITALTLDASQNATFAGKVASAGSLQLATNGTTTALTLDASQNATFAGSVNIPGGSGSINAINTFGFKNRIINGAMMIDQRNAGASVTPTTSNTYCIDRWTNYISQASKYSVQQNAGSVTPPAGFSKYLGVTSLSAYSILSTDYFLLIQNIEGYNIADLGWGTANAKTVTLSFQVYSSLTGTFGGSLKGASGTVYSYPFTYSIPTANTWTTISITIAGPTAGTWTSDNTTGIQVCLGLGAGSSFSGTAGAWVNNGNAYSATGATSVVGTNGATFYITGVQLEKGSTATSFDYRPYGTELNLCQRYCYTLGGAFNGSPSWNQYCTGALTSSTQFSGTMQIPVTMRASPSFSYSASSLSNFWVVSASAATNPTAIALNQASPTAFNITATVSGHTAGQAGVFYQNSGLATQLQLTAEL